MLTELWSALALVAVLEGLFLFAAPAAWKHTAEQLYALPNGRLRVVGGVVLVLGLLVLLWVRHRG